MYTLSISNLKGGVGKTTTAAAIGTFLSEAGYRVLYADIDAQRNITNMMQTETGEYSMYDVLTNNVSVKDAIYPAVNGFILPSDRRLSLLSTNTRTDLRTLKRALESVKKLFDIVIIDTPPSLGYLTLYALYACDGVLVPMKPDRYSLDGLQAMVKTLEDVRTERKEVGINGKVNLLGAILTEYNPRAVLHKSVYDAVKQQTDKLKTKLYTVRRTVACDEWQYNGVTAGSTAGADYKLITDELIRDIKLK